MNAYIFPGQGSQFSGMGKALFEENSKARDLFLQANEILGFEITKTMFDGSDDELKQTKITQPAIFIHSVVLSLTTNDFNPQMVAGHSLGEFSALVANKVLRFEDGLSLVYKRALAMQKACEANPSSMAAILGLEDDLVVKICSEVDGIVVAANFNCPGQLVISGATDAVNEACEKMKAAGAKRALMLPVGGAFHSPLMQPAREELAQAILETTFSAPICPIYQNVDALPHTDPEEIQKNLVSQLTAPVRWTQIVEKMVADGAINFIECGPGKVLQGLVKKIHRDAIVSSL
jgi:[acyl-carrier-protein] S-malonyltransferase